MTDKTQSIELARKMITTTSMSIDIILQETGVSHAQYRKVYPDTKITPSLALDIIDARDIDEFNIKEIKRIWNLTDSQLHYALYNPNAIQPPKDDFELPRNCVEKALIDSNGTRSQTDIAEEHNVSQSYVHKIAKELDMLPNRKKRVVLTAEQWRDIKSKLSATNATVEQLAKVYGVSRDTIYKGLRSSTQ